MTHPTEDHYYLSTACFHGLHDECRKTCKFCTSPCQCKDLDCECPKRVDEASVV